MATSTSMPAGTQAPTNPEADSINKAFLDAVQVVIHLAESAILRDQPWLGLPGIKQIWEGLFTWITSYFVRMAQDEIVFTVIDSEVAGEESSMSKALANLIAAEKSGDPNAIKQAIQAYANAQSALTRDDGSTSIH